MNAALVPVVIALIEAAAKYGPGLINSAISALGKDEITVEDIQGLKITKNPEEF